jgi:AcrR family transcriptional regulator
MMTVTDIGYASGMPRWEPDARGRLEQAAFTLYAERGFENTTVAEIAKRAGVTERTFFRHFADKREVLFPGSSDLREVLVSTVANAPDSLAPIDAVAEGLEAAAAQLQERVASAAALQERRAREFSRQRQTIIAASAELRERELIKLASLASALADTLRRRDLEDPVASLCAEIAITVFRVAFERWIEADHGDFPPLIRESLDELKALTSAESPPAETPSLTA